MADPHHQAHPPAPPSAPALAAAPTVGTQHNVVGDHINVYAPAGNLYITPIPAMAGAPRPLPLDTVSEPESQVTKPKLSRRTFLKAMSAVGGIAWLAGRDSVAGGEEPSPSRDANPSARSRASSPAPESGRSMTPSSAVAFPRFIGRVSDAACSFDGRYVVFGEESGSLQIWDLSTLRQTVTRQAHEGGVRRVVFNRDGSLLATSGPDGQGATVKLWTFSPPDGLKRVAMWYQDHDAWALAFHPAGTVLLSGDNNRTIWRYNVVRREPISNLIPGEELGWVRSFAFTKDGNSLLVGDTIGRIHRWDTTQPLQDWPWSWRTDIDDADPIGGIWALALAPDDTTLVSGDQPPHGHPRAHVRRWDLTDPTRRPNKPQVLAAYDNSTVYSADFSAKATLVTASKTAVPDARTGGTAHLWKMPYQHGKRLPTIINSPWVRFVPGTETLIAITAASQPIMIRQDRNPAR